MKRFTPTSRRGMAAITLLSWTALLGAERLRDEDAPAGEEKLLIYKLDGVLDGDRVQAMKKEIAGWIAEKPEIRTLILKLSSSGTKGGDLGPAREAAEYLSGLKDKTVVVHLETGQVAGNASALLAWAAKRLVMSPRSKIGYISNGEAKEPVEIPEAEEMAAAKAFGEFSPRTPTIGRSHLAQAMVSRSHPTVYMVPFTRDDNEGVEHRFLTDNEIAGLDAIEKVRQKGEKKPVVLNRQLLTLDQDKAREYKIADPLAGDSIDELQLVLGLHVGPENIIDHDRRGALKNMSPSGQTLVDVLNHPLTRFILVLLGTLGLLLEVKMPGTLVPAMGGLTCFAIFLIAGLFPTTGSGVPTTSLYEVLLFVIGLALIAVELLLLPGILFFGLSGAAACLVGLVLAMVPPSGTVPTGAMNYKEALMVLLAGGGASAGVFLILLRFLPHARFLDKSGIVIHSSIQGTPTGDSVIEAQGRSAALMGRTGKAVTPLRPSGTIEVDGQRVDVVAQGDFIEIGEGVQIIGADGTRTIVRRLPG